jgi:uncharacterized protein
MKLCADLTLPSDAATQTYGIVGRRGTGKSYFAGKLVELLLEARNQVVIIDPVGIWYGLRLLPNGDDSKFQIPILGGQRGDIPLEPTSGKLIADIVVENAGSMILDVSEMTGGEQRRFVGQFETELFQRKKKARSPLLLMFDEAQEFFPQHISGKDEFAAQMLGAGERLVKIGRNFGIGVGLITQRPQAVSKEVLNLTEVLVIFQTTGPQERKTIEDWVQEHGFDDRDIKDRLPGLAVGDGLLWSPQWLKTFRQIRVLPKKTFDASATPTESEAAIVPKPIDLTVLQKKMAETLERAKADDPRELKKQIAELRKVNLEHAKHYPVVDEAVIEKAVAAALAKERVEYQRALALLRDALPDDAANLVAHGVHDVAHRIDGVIELLKQERPAGVAQKVEHRFRKPEVARSIRAASSNGNGGGARSLPIGERTILTALIQYGRSVSRESLTVLTGYKRSSRDAYIQRLREKGYVLITDGNQVAATTAGADALPNVDPLPTGEALQEWHMQRLPIGERVILGELIRAYPKVISRDDLTESTAYKRSSRDAYLQRLAARMLVVREGGGVKASDELFA